MRSKLFLFAVWAIVLLALLVIVNPVPAYEAGIEGSSVKVYRELQKGYPGFTPETRSLPAIDGLTLPSTPASMQASKSEVIRQLRNQTFTPAMSGNVPGKPMPDPTPLPTPGYSFEPSTYSDGLSMKFYTWRASSEKTEAMNSWQAPTGSKSTISPITANGKKVTEANNQFAIDLYSYLANDPDLAGENLFFSPWSIATALAITYEGARGTTAEEMASVFHFPIDSAVRRAGFFEVISGLNRGGSGYTLKTANALWAEKSYAFLPEYTSIARSSYAAKVDTLDFVNNPEDSRTTINRWVAGQTDQKITNLLPAGSIHTGTALVITNAIYFKGTWDKQFNKENTVEEDFRVSDAQIVRVPMMKRTDADAKYWYVETDTLRVLGMPYAHKDGKELAMLILLPKDGDLNSVGQSITAGKVSELQEALTYRRVMVFIPKFRLETDYRLSETLEDMGMPSAFGGRADFSGMDGTGGLWIDDVFHSAFVDVNEEGTEAAAATATSMTMGMAFPIEPIPVFRADHPFIFLIQDSDTGNILFIGRMVNPAG